MPIAPRRSSASGALPATPDEEKQALDIKEDDIQNPSPLERTRSSTYGAVYEVPLNIGRANSGNDSDVYGWARSKDIMVLLEQDQPQWLHGLHVTREVADDILRRLGMHDGLFLVRERDSQGSNAKYALSMVVKGRPEHHLIYSLPNGTYSVTAARHVVGVDAARSLSDLIAQQCRKGTYLSRAICVPKRTREEEGFYPDWFHGNLPRDEARLRLTGTNIMDGKFLVRLSGDKKGGYKIVLSVVSHARIHHHIMVQKREWFINSLRLTGCFSLSDAINALAQPRADFTPTLRSFVRRPPQLVVSLFSDTLVVGPEKVPPPPDRSNTSSGSSGYDGKDEDGREEIESDININSGGDEGVDVDGGSTQPKREYLNSKEPRYLDAAEIFHSVEEMLGPNASEQMEQQSEEPSVPPLLKSSTLPRLRHEKS